MNKIFLLLLICGLGYHWSDGQQLNTKSKGFLSFRIDGMLYKADSTHARAYSIKSATKAFLSAANKNNMLLDVQWNVFKGPDTYIINKSKGSADFVINHQTYTFIRPDDFIKVTITGIREKGTLLLLKGNFEGRLRDRNGKEINISEGKFETIQL
ncbi:MAG: hypothetical protein ACK55K_01615 [Bacteroidota bacterium]|jgi:hypothetical protein